MLGVSLDKHPIGSEILFLRRRRRFPYFDIDTFTTTTGDRGDHILQSAVTLLYTTLPLSSRPLLLHGRRLGGGPRRLPPPNDHPCTAAMADSMPIPRPPRTPTPPPDDHSSPQKTVAFDAEDSFDPNSLSPHQFEPDYMVPSPGRLITPTTPDRSTGGVNGNGAGPFNFQPSTLAKSPVVKSVRQSHVSHGGCPTPIHSARSYLIPPPSEQNC